MEKKSFRPFLSDVITTIRGPHVMGGIPAGKGNQLLVTQFYTAWLHLASDVLSQSDVSPVSYKARIANFADALQRGDVLDILTICQSAATVLIDNSADSYSGFKARLYDLHPETMKIQQGLLSPVNPLIVALFECPDVKAVSLKPVLSFLRFGKKLNFEAIGLEAKAIADYKGIEDMLTTVDLGSFRPLVSGLNEIMRFWLKDLDLKNLIPKHGGGSVAEGKLSLYEKFHVLGSDAYLRTVLQESLPDYYPSGYGYDFARVSRTIFVPKTFSKLRTISMEPATLQYFQQGVMKKLYDHIDSHPYLGRRIQLRCQDQNRNMARQGSLDNSLSTIDLSSASDTVSWALVKAVFDRTPLLKWLYVTRSKRTMLPNGEIVELKKFAPMGSALCFPIECLIFASTVEYVTQKWCKKNNLAKPDYSVFGDDIIVAKAITEDVIQALTSLGFIVNRQKSFTDGPFRESCGGDYYEGTDVSSVYYRLPAYQVNHLAPDVYAAICSACNLCTERGLPILRSYYLSLITKKYPPYFTSTVAQSPAVYSSQPTNFHVSRRWNEDWQLYEGKFCTVKSRPVKQTFNDCDQIAYFVKLAEMAYRSDKPSTEPVSDISLHGTSSLLGVMRREVDGLVTPSPSLRCK